MKIFGILNITADSFSDGGEYLCPEKALKKAIQLKEEGADVIDIGAAASHPDAVNVSSQEQIQRIEPLIRYLQEKKIPISVDTFDFEVQKFVLHHNVDYLNDITGLQDKKLYPYLEKSKSKVILMHSLQKTGKADKREFSPESIIENIINFFQERILQLTNFGIERHRIIIDPGMGFFLGTNPYTSLEVIKNTSLLQELFQLPLFISVSKKSFLRNMMKKNIEEVMAANTATEIYLYHKKVSYIRTHNVQFLKDVLTTMEYLK